MSKDSSFTYVHFHASHHADLFEEFCHPPSSNPNTNPNNNSSSNTNQSTNTDPSDPSLAHVPGHFLPFESIHLPQHLMPKNPEDEDGVVPDMHAAFGIAGVMGQSGMPEVSGEQSGRGITTRPEDLWRDFGLDALANGVGNLGVVDEVGPNIGSERIAGPVLSQGSGVAPGARRGPRREGRRHGVLSMR